ncbi:Outer membrane protein beta-barrel domain-containing protein [Nonlabens sp. Hel1_33_55]|uniref:porin family protein n=1 Tax=Nonlabens sp. Hel1_33_55 TaxID=1336802 RepID=UPI000875B81A|nr:porin family protein [Nonlabens sp. Hel1_33_55]SCX90066.1 Outer membrane protein beta-barrel domain-containing protein [Nonlabens sp. Hel1_33_55]
MKTIISTAVLLMAALFSQAQFSGGDVTVAPHIGLALGTYSTDDNVTYNYREALAVGASLDYYFSDRWSLRSGLFYAPIGAEDDFDNVDKLNYLSIPVNANWHFGSRRNWYLNFGFSAKFLLSAKGELSTGEEIDLENFIKSTDFGLDLGIGYRFNVNENFMLFGEVQGYGGFIDVLDINDVVTPELRNSSSTINFGAIFKL